MEVEVLTSDVAAHIVDACQAIKVNAAEQARSTGTAVSAAELGLALCNRLGDTMADALDDGAVKFLADHGLHLVDIGKLTAQYSCDVSFDIDNLLAALLKLRDQALDLLANAAPEGVTVEQQKLLDSFV